ncbi:PREDICTED: ABC transporter A family member 3-like [Populus euphratica]|uniref:ABC transporter A family member 3-like n=1 Tax=Populus euphratica TaxID=75702 RepID=A0AAJ6XCE1_POPEU|nr:PREDICTED: ABC transporter A family member 3-like [Populus euphratica]
MKGWKSRKTGGERFISCYASRRVLRHAWSKWHTTPTSGAAYVDGLDMQTQMDSPAMGCSDRETALTILWKTEEPKRFCYEKMVADKHAGKYSGGTKRRLGVAISLIGDHKIVYMDEPSTGLDPASRSTLWNVVKRAEQEKENILTTLSMEEADYLCDRV